MSQDIRLRPANQNDSLFIAKSMIIASGGIIEFLFSASTDKLVLLNKILSFEILKESSPISYTNTIIAEYADKAIGMVTGYRGYLYNLTNRISNLSPEKLKCLQPFYEVDLSDTFYIDSVYVDKKFRGKRDKQHSLAYDLLDAKLIEGKRQNFSVASIYCWESNYAAIALFNHLNFKKVKRIFANECSNFKLGARILYYKEL